MQNAEIRKMAREKKVFLWEIAAALNVSEPTIFRWLRFPLPPDREERILEAIEKISQERRTD